MSTLELITQEARPRSDWPYEQDWIVSRVTPWKAGNGVAIEGVNMNYPEGTPDRHFYWLFDRCSLQRPLDWRYDFTNAVFE